MEQTPVCGAAIALARELPASRTPDRKTLSLRAT